MAWNVLYKNLDLLVMNDIENEFLMGVTCNRYAVLLRECNYIIQNKDMSFNFTRRSWFHWRIMSYVALFAQMVPGQAPELGQGWVPEFSLAARQLVALAEAIPPEKFSWRPGPGVRSASEVFMHVAVGNYYLLAQAGGKIPDDTPPISPDLEKKVKEKAEVIRWLNNSMSAVRKAYPATNRSKSVRFLNKDTTSESVFLRILVHSHEHMGQAIAYARMMGIRPPWSNSE